MVPIPCHHRLQSCNLFLSTLFFTLNTFFKIQTSTIYRLLFANTKNTNKMYSNFTLPLCYHKYHVEFEYCSLGSEVISCDSQLHWFVCIRFNWLINIDSSKVVFVCFIFAFLRRFWLNDMCALSVIRYSFGPHSHYILHSHRTNRNNNNNINTRPIFVFRDFAILTKAWNLLIYHSLAKLNKSIQLRSGNERSVVVDRYTNIA